MLEAASLGVRPVPVLRDHVEAVMAFQREDRARVLTLLSKAEDEFGALELLVDRDMTRWCAGRFNVKPNGLQPIAETDAALAGRGVVDCARFIHAHLGGFGYPNSQRAERSCDVTLDGTTVSRLGPGDD